jgi:hypothetical protein
MLLGQLRQERRDSDVRRRIVDQKQPVVAVGAVDDAVEAADEIVECVVDRKDDVDAHDSP